MLSMRWARSSLLRSWLIADVGLFPSVNPALGATALAACPKVVPANGLLVACAPKENEVVLGVNCKPEPVLVGGNEALWPKGVPLLTFPKPCDC